MCQACVILSTIPSRPATFVQRLPNVFQTSMVFGTSWVVVEQMSMHYDYQRVPKRPWRLEHVG